jgi:hypothetical protein
MASTDKSFVMNREIGTTRETTGFNVAKRAWAKRRGWQTFAVALVALTLILGACGGGDEEATATSVAPTAVPTAGSVAHSFQPITADLVEDTLAFIAAIPAFERNCLVEAVGQVRFDEIAAGDLDVTDEEGEELLGCISGVTFGRVLAGGLINETALESFSVATLDCMETRFSAATPSDFVESFEELTGDDPMSTAFDSADDALSVVLPAFFCMNDDERAVLDADFAEEASGFAPTITQLECMYDSLGDEGLSGLFEGDTPPLEMFGVISECGFDLGGLSGALPIPTFEIPDISGLDLSELELPEGLNLTVEQIACLQDAGILQRIADGDIGFDMLGIVGDCDVDFAGLLGR